MTGACVTAVDACCGRLSYACATHPSPWSRCRVCGEPRGDRKVRPVEWTGAGEAATFRYIEADGAYQDGVAIAKKAIEDGTARGPPA